MSYAHLFPMQSTNPRCPPLYVVTEATFGFVFAIFSPTIKHVCGIIGSFLELIKRVGSDRLKSSSTHVKFSDCVEMNFENLHLIEFTQLLFADLISYPFEMETSG
jgi:hypothetical protein